MGLTDGPNMLALREGRAMVRPSSDHTTVRASRPRPSPPYSSGTS